jgi:UDPglucose 6-dehydrogenase
LLGVKIAIVGTGYVGLVSGACLSDFGHEVVAFDTDEGKIAGLGRGEMPIYEPGLADLVARNVAARRLSFVTDLGVAVDGAEAIFLAVGTPARRGNGHADLRFVFEATEAIAGRLRQPTVVICKSTVPVGTNRRVLARLRELRPDAAVEVASNPEFLREGAAIEDFKRPDRIVVGVEPDHAREVLKAIYRPLSLNETPILFTDLETAELVKYAANAFLATKISFINEIADLCERVGANVQDVARGIGLDRRIGPKFLHAGPGYGGSCFPKDTRALIETAREANLRLRIIEAVAETNAERKGGLAARVITALGGSVRGKKVAVLGLTFKPNTDDMRDAPSLALIPKLQEAGASIRVHDPEGMREAAKHLAEVEWCDGPYHAAEGADAVVLLTEWDAYRALDLVRVERLMQGKALVDLRNVYKPHEVAAAGLDHFPVGFGRSRGPADPALGQAAD